MRLVDLLLGRKSVYAIRKEYDRLRERTDKETNIDRRIAILHVLDSIEPSIVVLEEHIVSDYEKKKMIRFIKENLKRVRFMINDKDYFRSITREIREEQQQRFR